MMEKKNLDDLEKTVSKSPRYTAWGNDLVQELIKHIRELEEECRRLHEVMKDTVNTMEKLLK